MASSAVGIRPKRSRARSRLRPSVREVCLIGVDRPSRTWEQGERVTWSGRVYRVEATQAGAGYVHLATEPESTRGG
jgi:hypothetical protein